jgi:hypothetical protein
MLLPTMLSLFWKDSVAISDPCFESKQMHNGGQWFEQTI